MAPNFEQLIPGLAELRADERQHRALAFAGVTWTVCGRELVCLTPRHRLHLQLVRNAFTVVDASPLAGDIFQILWLLREGGGVTPHRPTFAQGLRRWWLRRHVSRLDLGVAVADLYRFLIAQLQDSPESTAGAAGTDQSLWVHWIAEDASFWMSVHGGFTLAAYMDTPYVVLQQLYRAWKCNNPTVAHDSSGRATIQEPHFINRSDVLVNLWQQQHRQQLAAFILGHRERKL